MATTMIAIGAGIEYPRVPGHEAVGMIDELGEGGNATFRVVLTV